jgi:O-succinylbenzoic acid--CoA ligase
VRLGRTPRPLGELQRALEVALATDGLALTVSTSGSTGRPREVALSAAALRSAADALAERLGGHGGWLLALPVEHIAGAQVVIRSIIAGRAPAALPPGVTFTAAAFAAAAAKLAAPRRYTSLVPTQLHRLMTAEPEGTDALRAFDAVLVGGAPCPPRLLERARAAGLRVVTTYGMTETAGGCVYDGVPLDGTRVALDRVGRILLTGPTLASGYVIDDETLARGELADSVPGDRGAAFESRSGVRWVRSSDLGELDATGRVVVLGRADDVIVTGGVKVAPEPVEAIVAAVPGIRDVCVVGLADGSWGEQVVAVVAVEPGAAVPELEDLRARVTKLLGAAHAPRAVVALNALPMRGPGKVDRRATATAAAERLAEPD